MGLNGWRRGPEGDLQAQVISFIASRRNSHGDLITPAHRLLHDLGLDGDEAGAFFREFGQRFDVDLAPLYQHWDRHFGAEPILSPWLLIFPAAAALAWTLARSGDSPIWAILAAGAGVGAWIWWSRQRRASRPFVHITVADLIDAAATGRWPIDYFAGRDG